MKSVFYRMGLPLVDMFESLLFDLDISRHSALPAGPKILASNHPSTTDPFLILELTPDPVHILVEERLFKVPLFGTYLHLAGHIPVLPGNGRAAFDSAVETLRDGKTVAIYPEGSISPLEGGVHPPKTGAARLALATGAPVIPIGVALDRSRIRLVTTMIDGKPAVGTWYFHGPYSITMGSPIRFHGDVEDRELVRRVSGQILRQIVQLSGESERRLAVRKEIFRPAAGLLSWWKDTVYG